MMMSSQEEGLSACPHVALSSLSHLLWLSGRPFGARFVLCAFLSS